MRKWGKVLPVVFKVAVVLSLVLTSVAGHKWG